MIEGHPSFGVTALASPVGSGHGSGLVHGDGHERSLERVVWNRIIPGFNIHGAQARVVGPLHAHVQMQDANRQQRLTTRESKED